jgi:hypothetical protein
MSFHRRLPFAGEMNLHSLQNSTKCNASYGQSLKQDNFSITNACEDFSIDVSTPNMLMSFSSYSLGL